MSGPGTVTMFPASMPEVQGMYSTNNEGVGMSERPSTVSEPAQYRTGEKVYQGQTDNQCQWYNSGPPPTPEPPGGRQSVPFQEASASGAFVPPSPTQPYFRSAVQNMNTPEMRNRDSPGTPLHRTSAWFDSRYSRSPGDHSFEFRTPSQRWKSTPDADQLEKKRTFENELGLRPYYFKGRRNVLSNFYPFELNIFHRDFSSSEAAYQYCKAVMAKCWDVAEELVRCNSGLEAKSIAHRIPAPVDWCKTKEPAMKVILEAKLEQCEPFRRFLLDHNYKHAYLVEDTNNAFWARGHDYKGKNVLGHMIMDLREQLTSGKSYDRVKSLKEFMKLIPDWPADKTSTSGSKRSSWSHISPHSNRSNNASAGGSTEYYSPQLKRQSYPYSDSEYERRKYRDFHFDNNERLGGKKRKRDREVSSVVEIKKEKEDQELKEPNVHKESLHEINVTQESEKSEKKSEKKAERKLEKKNASVTEHDEHMLEVKKDRDSDIVIVVKEEESSRKPLEDVQNLSREKQREECSRKLKMLRSELRKMEADEANQVTELKSNSKAANENKWWHESQHESAALLDDKKEVRTVSLKGTEDTDISNIEEVKTVSLIPLPSKRKNVLRSAVSATTSQNQANWSSDSSSDSSESDSDPSPRKKRRKMSRAKRKRRSSSKRKRLSSSEDGRSSTDSRKRKIKKRKTKVKASKFSPKSSDGKPALSDESVISKERKKTERNIATLEKQRTRKKKKKVPQEESRPVSEKKRGEASSSSSSNSNTSSDSDRSVKKKRRSDKSHGNKRDKRSVSEDSQDGKLHKKKKRCSVVKVGDKRSASCLDSDSDASRIKVKKKKPKAPCDTQRQKRSVSTECDTSKLGKRTKNMQTSERDSERSNSQKRQDGDSHFTGKDKRSVFSEIKGGRLHEKKDSHDTREQSSKSTQTKNSDNERLHQKIKKSDRVVDKNCHRTLDNNLDSENVDRKNKTDSGALISETDQCLISKSQVENSEARKTKNKRRDSHVDNLLSGAEKPESSKTTRSEIGTEDTQPESGLKSRRSRSRSKSKSQTPTSEKSYRSKCHRKSSQEKSCCDCWRCSCLCHRSTPDRREKSKPKKKR